MNQTHLKYHSPIPRKGIYNNSVKLLLVLSIFSGERMIILHAGYNDGFVPNVRKNNFTFLYLNNQTSINVIKLQEKKQVRIEARTHDFMCFRRAF